MTSPNDPQRDDRDIATLIRTAGPRPAVPEERMERVRAAATAAWQAELHARQRRRFLQIAVPLAAAAMLVLAVALGWLAIPLGDALTGPQPGIAVEAASGGLRAVDPDGRAVEVAAGTVLAPGSVLSTADTGRAILRVAATGHSVRLDRGTRVRFGEAGRLDLETGGVYVDSGPDSRSGALTVSTPLGTIEEIGTQFEVRLDGGALRVRLREGKVVLHADAASYPVALGTELTLAADGTTRVRPLPPYDDAWDWVVAVPTRFELEGRTAREFLDGVARELGLKLVFSDESLARRAEEIVLSGTLDGVSVEEALATVLPTCRMRSRVDNGLLLIGPLES